MVFLYTKTVVAVAVVAAVAEVYIHAAEHIRICFKENIIRFSSRNQPHKNARIDVGVI